MKKLIALLILPAILFGCTQKLKTSQWEDTVSQQAPVEEIKAERVPQETANDYPLNIEELDSLLSRSPLSSLGWKMAQDPRDDAAKGKLSDITTFDKDNFFYSTTLETKVFGKMRSGVLEDESGKINVLINPTTKTDEELSAELTHLISCQKTDSGMQFVVQLSAD